MASRKQKQNLIAGGVIAALAAGLAILASGGSRRKTLTREGMPPVPAPTKLTSPVDVSRLASGYYTAVSDSPAYVALKLAALRDLTVEIVGEGPYGRTDKFVTVRITRTPRLLAPAPARIGAAPIAVPPGKTIERMPANSRWFNEATREYGNWREAWWREVIQNSVDAGATQITLEIKDRGDGTFSVSCDDNGAGMDEGTLLGRFLELGGTDKPADATGGFGAAKRLILLPWLGWKIETRNLSISGIGDERLIPPDKVSFRKGTKVTVIMSRDTMTTPDAAFAYVEKCNLPRVNFKFIADGLMPWDNGKVAKLKPGVPIDTGEYARYFDGKAKLYFLKHGKSTEKYRDQESRYYVRANGLYMFGGWIDESAKGHVFVELTAKTTEVLKTNREDFAPDSNLQYALQKVTYQIAKNEKEILRQKKNLVKKTYRGTGLSTSTDEMATRLLGILGGKPRGPKSAKTGKQELALDQITDLVNLLGMFTAGGGGTGSGAVGGGSWAQDVMAPGSAIAEMLAGLQFKGQEHLESTLHQIVGKPDYRLVNEIEGLDKKTMAMFEPETMPAPVARLLRIWTELCRFALIQLSVEESFGTGFILDDKTVAQFSNDEGTNWLLLNPFDLTSPDKRRLLSPGGAGLQEDYDLRDIYASAVHESTHLLGYHNHDKSFANALTSAVRDTMVGVSKIVAIVDAIPTASKAAPPKQIPPPGKPGAGKSGTVPPPAPPPAPKKAVLMPAWKQIQPGQFSTDFAAVVGFGITTYVVGAGKSGGVALIRDAGVNGGAFSLDSVDRGSSYASLWSWRDRYPIILDKLSGTGAATSWKGNNIVARVSGANAIWSSGAPSDLDGNMPELWVVGDRGAVGRFNGEVWSRSSAGPGVTLNAIWGASGSKGAWAVGNSGVIVYFDGRLWSVSPNTGTVPYYGVWGSAMNDVYAVGRDGIVAHWPLGGPWRKEAAGLTTKALRAVWGSGPNDVYVVGDAGTILHYDGNAWSTMESGVVANLRAVWGSGPKDVWAVGDKGTILHLGD